MTNVIVPKDIIEAIGKSIGENEAERIVFQLEKESSEVILRIQFGNSGKKLDGFGFSIDSMTVKFPHSDITDSSRYVFKENSNSILAFILNSKDSEDDLRVKFPASSGKTSLVCGSTELFYQSEKASIIKELYTSDLGSKIPILSFSKEEFKEQIVDKIKNLSTQVEWINKKVAGVNIIISNDSAHLFVAAKAFYFKSPINKGVFYPESSKAFIHDEGVLFLKEEFLNDIYNVASDEVKIYYETPATEEEDNCSFNFQSGGIIFHGNSFSRKKILEISKKNVDQMLTEKVKNEVSVNLKEFRKFFIPFRNNQIFINDVISLQFSSSKKSLKIKPFEEGSELFECEISSKDIGSDTRIDLNFFVLDSISSILKGDNIYFKEVASNPKRVIITDGNAWFIAGKTLVKND